MSQLDFTTVVAVIGAATGVLALLLQYAGYKRDRARLHVTVTKGVIVTQSSTSEPMVWVEAVNAGRRPVQVVNAGLIGDLAPADRLVMFGDLRTLPKTVNEGEVVKVSADADSVARETVLAGRGLPRTGYVTDSVGRTYSVRVSKDVRRLVSETAARLGSVKTDA